MDKWGTLMVASVHTVAEMVAVGLELPPNTFLDILENGPHLLAPTGSDLDAYHHLGDIFAGSSEQPSFLFKS
jgi:hypothetical protein